MTLSEFIEQFDKENSIVLLAGKRKVLDADQQKLVSLGRLLASRTQKMIFRSGNADGSDSFFATGVAAVDNTRLEVITPYSGHRKKTNQAYTTHAIDTVPIAADSEVVYQTVQSNAPMKQLIEQYIAGKRDRLSIKAAYIIRDTIMAIGTDEIKPATFGIFYDDLRNPQHGGTGHTMRVCQRNSIPKINQRVWFDWLKE